MEYIHPLVQRFLQDCKEFGIEEAAFDTDLEALAQADPDLAQAVNDFLNSHAALYQLLQSEYGVDLDDDDGPDYECDEDDDDDEGEEWKNGLK